MKDIANELGVSVALVSYVLNGKRQTRLMRVRQLALRPWLLK
ncbi:hypothetical protein PIECOFPK_00670 [Mycovorax composti]|uniref:HTH lacI-type domain-containing protein n=2 Tax=Mycovorax composti TaxID=2962693 RepID=A0ABZ2EHH1_9BACT